MLAAFKIILAQDKASARRLEELGAPSVRQLSNLKLASDPLPADEGELGRLQSAIGPRPVWCAASTHKEEHTIGEAHRLAAGKLPGLLTILAPRQPRRADPVASDLEASGLRVARRSLGEMPGKEIDVYLVDTIGDMGLVFRLAPISFMGRSLIDKGGSNPLEPTQLGSAVLHGPLVDNFDELYSALIIRGGSVQIGTDEDLANAVVHLSTQTAARDTQVAKALTLVEEAQEVLSQTRDTALKLLENEGSHAAP